jgi:ribose 5-phosphate isomerase B
MKVAIDADKNGLDLKKALADLLKEKGVDFVDLDYLKTDETGDYPDVAFNLAKGIQKKQFDRGILICGTGLGMAICANKVKGVYAGNCTDVYAAERLKKSNDAQVLTLGAQVVGVESAKVIVDAWLSSEFQGGRSRPKVARIRELEANSFSENS